MYHFKKDDTRYIHKLTIEEFIQQLVRKPVSERFSFIEKYAKETKTSTEEVVHMVLDMLHEEIILKHSTDAISLYKIIESQHLLSADKLHLSGTSGEDSRMIYMTPMKVKHLKKSMNDFSLYLDFEKTTTRYPSYFINTSNLFGPGTGIKRGNCNCFHTFYSEEFKKTYADGVGKECYLDRQDDILKKIFELYDEVERIEDSCDGGAEIGFYCPDIKLKDILKCVYLPTKFTPYYEKRITTNLGLSVDEYVSNIEQMVNDLGGEVNYYRVRGGKRTKKYKR